MPARPTPALRSGEKGDARAEDGTEGPVAEIGEPLGAGAVPFAGRLLLSGSDGTLLVVPAL